MPRIGMMYDSECREMDGSTIIERSARENSQSDLSIRIVVQRSLNPSVMRDLLHCFSSRVNHAISATGKAEADFEPAMLLELSIDQRYNYSLIQL
jgi:hypothetical protein